LGSEGEGSEERTRKRRVGRKKGSRSGLPVVS
jgi:hypothetical protein